MRKARVKLLAAVLMASSVMASGGEPQLRIFLDKSSYRPSEPIMLRVVFELGAECWTLNPNVTELTFSLHVFDRQHREIPDIPQYVMYRLPRCNLSTFCRVDAISTHIFLRDKGPDMYASYYRLNAGRYSVKAIYDSEFLAFAAREDEDEYCRTMGSRKDLIKHLESNVVEFEVLPTEPADDGSYSEEAPGGGTEDTGKSSASPRHEAAPRPNGDGGSGDHVGSGG